VARSSVALTALGRSSPGPTTAEELLSLRGLRARPRDAPLTLALAAGERLALLGANGAGKTTLLRVVLGLSAAASGAIERSCAPIGYVPQDFRAGLFPWLRVRQNLALALSAEQARACPADAALAPALRTVPLRPELLDRYPDRLSGGEQQLVAIARAFVAAPRLLVLDEPFSALDAPTRLALVGALIAWTEERGAALIVVAHEIDTVVQLAHRAVVLRADAAPDALTLAGLEPERAASLLRAALASRCQP
jgi:sulfonate transport system ATP-binding protein